MLIVVVFTHRVAGFTAAVASALAMILLYQESPEHIWLWANLLVAVAIARSALPGRWRLWLQRYRAISFGLMALALLPLLWGQLRLAIHPQLEGSNPMLMRRDVAEQGTLDKAAYNGPPPPRPVDAPAPMSVAADAAAVASSALEEVVTTASRTRDSLGLNAVQSVSRYAPGTLLQAGPGVPAWQYNNYDYFWTGPVQSTDTVRFVYIGPLLLALWRIVGVVFTGLWFAWLLQASFGINLRLPKLPWGAAKTLSLLLVVCLVAAVAPAARAAATPDNTVLQELRNRLLKAPDCLPTCSELNAARVNIEGNRLEVTLQVAALASVAVPIPNAGNRWQIDALTIDGQSALTLSREADGSLWVPLRSGAHAVRIVARVDNADVVSLSFPQVPRTISVSAQGWDAAGVNNGRLVAGALDLSRRRSVGSHGTASIESTQFPAFVRVTRNVRLDIDWSVATTVERLAPNAAAINVALPLLAGESVLTPGMQVRGKGAETQLLAGIAAGAAGTGWNSGLAKSETLELNFPLAASRTEVWNFSVSPQWSVAFAGFPAVLPENVAADNWVFQYWPRPGETIALKITRPESANGTTLAIDNVSRQIQFGIRSVDEKLNLNYRSTQGGRHTIQLPADARVQAVSIDNEPVPLRPENGELSINLLPGAHAIGVDWQRARGAGFRSGLSRVDLHANASNIHTVVVLPHERWPLASTRALAGPVIRYWGELLVFILTAAVLGRIARSPLRTLEWLLLGFGLSTQSWTVFALMVAWFFAMRWRAGWQPAEVSKTRFRLVQIALALLTVIAIGSLLFSGIRYGFLSAPDMGVAGDGSYGTTFSWFHDQATGVLPEVAIYSVPLWCYKTLMFAWALWIAVALARWLRWAWSAWMHDGVPWSKDA